MKNYYRAVQTALEQNKYERRYAEYIENYNAIKANMARFQNRLKAKRLRENYLKDSSGHWKSRGGRRI